MLCVIRQNLITLSFIIADYYYAECLYAECCYAEYHHVVCYYAEFDYAEYCYANVSMQIAIKLSVNKHMITQRDTLLCVIQYNVITLSVVAQI
jgi:hypothetical protein